MCTRCGRPFEGVTPEVIAHTPKPQFVAASEPPPQTARSRPSMLSLYGAWAFIVVVELIFVLLNRLSLGSATFALVGGGCLCVAAFHLWRDIDLVIRGVQAMGTVLSIDFHPSYDRYGNERGGTFFKRASYLIDEVPYFVRSEYGSNSQNYQVGQLVEVWYDSGSPDIAVLGSRISYQSICLLNLGLVMSYLAAAPGVVYRIIGTPPIGHRY